MAEQHPICCHAATKGDVRRNIGDQSKSGPVVLNVSFVAEDRSPESRKRGNIFFVTGLWAR
jgi:hypothetical protein